MIRFLQISLLMLISILLGTLKAYACHEGDFTALSKGHYKWGKSAGLLQYTENITISSSTSTSCDMYTAYLWRQYDSIQEQGEHLDAIAIFSGCTEPVTEIFKGELAQNYQSLFSSQGDPVALRNQIGVVIQNNEELRTSCQGSKFIPS